MRLFAACALVSVLAAPAFADVESELVRAGVQAYEDLEYAKAVDLLKKALAETLTREERVATYKALGFSHAALGHADQARDAFVELLRLNPGFDLDRTISPRTRAIFEEARARVAMSADVAGAEKLPQVVPKVEPRRAREGQPITFSLVYRGGVAEKMQVFYRQRGKAAFSRGVVAGSGGSFELVVPGSEVSAPGLEYYLVLLDDSGASVAGAGSLAQPRSLDVQGRPKPIYKRPVFWGVLGGVLAAGAIAGGVAAGVTASQTGPNTPATLTIEPH